jgi:glycosyltransferase involved in cell wall biosynthesis
MSKIKSQDKTGEVEVLTYVDEGKMSIGSKRNCLLRMATGDYVAFVDDDDDVSDDYVAKVLQAIESECDCCSLSGRIIFSDGYARNFYHSLKYESWIDDHEKKEYYRPPNHLNAVKRSIAANVVFPSFNSGEDRVYSMSLRSRIKTEAPIDGVIYIYNCSKTFEETHGGISR